MSDRLTVDSGETYTVDSGDTEEYAGAEVDGTLDVQGQLKLIDDPDSPDRPFEVSDSPIDLPLASLNFTSMNVGVSIFLVGILGVLGTIGAVLKNYAAVVMLMFAVTALLLSGLVGIGLETFWVLILATVLLIAAGMALRWLQ